VGFAGHGGSALLFLSDLLESGKKTSGASQLDYDKLRILCYPDPRLRRACEPVVEFGEPLAALAARMFELMRAARGVGLAAPQVGARVRMFVMNATTAPKDDLVCVNPEIIAPDGARESEEGCLSLPEVRVQIRRARRCGLRAQDALGRPFELSGQDLVARVWQHELDHLNGVLIIDRMGPADRIANKRALKELEDNYRVP